jgi:hypothetical protein
MPVKTKQCLLTSLSSLLRRAFQLTFESFCVFPPTNTLVSDSSHKNMEKHGIYLTIMYSCKRMENIFEKNDDVTSMKFENHLR